MADSASAAPRASAVVAGRGALIHPDIGSVRADLHSLGERVARLEGAFAYLRPAPAPDSK